MDDNNRNRKKNDRTIVTHGTGVYDVTSFADIHPGGRKYFDAFNKKVTSSKFIFLSKRRQIKK